MKKAPPNKIKRHRATNETPPTKEEKEWEVMKAYARNILQCSVSFHNGCPNAGPMCIEMGGDNGDIYTCPNCLPAFLQAVKTNVLMLESDLSVKH